MKDPSHLREVERMDLENEDTDFVGCVYSYNQEKTPDMESSPGNYLIHPSTPTPSRASIFGDFGLQTTSTECRPEIVSIDKSGVQKTLGKVTKGSEVYLIIT